jgi:Zn-dependent peptidase ImmA (M78 family)
MSKVISNLKFKRVTEVAYEVLYKADIAKAPVDLEKILNITGVTAEEADLGPDVSGLLAIHNGHGMIAYSAEQSNQRQRFTIAHELGHFLLHKPDSEDTVFVDKDFIVKYRSNKAYTEIELRQEQEANAFAASLLMPKDLLFEELSKENIRSMSESALIDELARTFDVSVPAMTFRLSNLNVLY